MSALFETAVNTKTAEAKRNFILVNPVVRLLFTILRNAAVTRNMKAIEKKKKRMFQQGSLEFILSLAKEN